MVLKPSEVYHLPLQPVSHYRRRQLDQLNEWLPREKLYALPRSLKTQGARALGRLAFTDNYLRLLARLKREILQANHPDALYQSVTQTGLALRDNTPRVYVVGCASGGSSGQIIDLGYAVRRLLKQMQYPEANVVSLLFCGAPDDPATPRQEQANVYATLTELNHFSDPTVPFAAQYGMDGPRLVDEGSPYDCTYLLTLQNRTPEARREAMAHLGSYLFHELTTPLGLRLERCRQRALLMDGSPFRSLGTFGVWFPRGLMLRLAARRVCRRILEDWQLQGSPSAHAEVEASYARLVADPELTTEALAGRITDSARQHLEGAPSEVLTRLLAGLEEQSQQLIAQDDPGGWARQALQRVMEWLGSGVQHSSNGTSGKSGERLNVMQRKSRLSKSLETAAAHLAEEWEQRFTGAAFGLMEHPGRRIAAAEAALTRLIQFCSETSATQEQRLTQLHDRTRQSQQQLQTAVEACVTGGGFAWFGNRTRRQLRVFMDHLAAFARQCLAEDLATTVTQFYQTLRGRLTDRLRDLALCRQRLRHLQETLETAEYAGEDNSNDIYEDESMSQTPMLSPETFWESLRDSRTIRVVLPEGATDLIQAAARFVQTLSGEQWTQVDQSFQDQVLSQRGGLYQSCVGISDLMRHLVHPLLNQAVNYLSGQLPITDVAQVETTLDPLEEGEPITRLQTYHDQAEPLLKSTPAPTGPAPLGKPLSKPPLGRNDATLPPDQTSFLLVPASEAGKEFGQIAEQIMPQVQLVSVAGQADLMFCREQEGLSPADLERILKACRSAYEESAPVPQHSPHARFDIMDWTPLDP
jgi:hypothetical protein